MRLDKSVRDRLNGIKLSDDIIDVTFGHGSLGLQILDVPERGVLVWHLDGQALDSKELKIGAQVVKVGKVDCSGLDMKSVFEVVTREARPVVIKFRLPVADADDVPIPRVVTPPPADVPGTTQVRLEQVDKTLTQRLRNLQASDEADQAVVDKPGGKPHEDVNVVFHKGPLGLQISDVGKRVLVTSFENNPDGSVGQAQKSGLIHFGYQIIRIGKESCEGLTMHQIGMMVSKHKRPVVIGFRKLYERESSKGSKIVSGPRPKRCLCIGRSFTRASLETDPFFFHFQMLCKAAQIKILLNFEDSKAKLQDDKQYNFEISYLPYDQLYEDVVNEGIAFFAWPTWIRGKYIEAYLDEEKRIRNGSTMSPRSPVFRRQPSNEDLESSEGDRCAFCTSQLALREKAKGMDDDMYIHFALLFEGIKARAEEDKKDSQKSYVEYLETLDVDQLYNKCQEEGVSLHTWDDWIKKQCVWGYEEQLYKVALSGDTELDLRDMIKENRNI